MPKPIKALIPAVLQRATAKRQELQQLQRRWDQLVGRELAAHTRLMTLRRGKLYVHTDEPGVSFALSLEKPRLLQQLKTRAGGEPIEDIIVRAGEP